MADAQLQVVIKARNDAKATFDSVNKQVGQMQGKTGFGGLNDKLGAADAKFKSLTGVSLGFATAAGLAGSAISGFAKFLTDSVNETVEYATEIDNMSRLLGISTEETSRLVQASDDLFVSQETLKSGLQAATRQGIDVSIEGLKSLADEYLALPEGVERSEFVLKTFGRSGAEMGKLMEQGAAGIDAATAAIAENMIVTERSMQDIMNYKRSIDNLNDSWQGFKYTVGQAVIPQLDLLFRVMTKGKDEVEAHAQAVNRLEMQLDRAASAAAIGSDSAAAAMVTLQAELDALNEGFYSTEGATGAVTDEISGLGTSLTMVTQYFGELNEQILFNRLAANMTEESALALGRAMGLVNEETVFLTGEMDALTAKYDANMNGVIEAAEMTEQYYEEVATLLSLIEGAESKTVTLTVRTLLDDQQGLFGQGPKNGYIGLAEGNRATGGPVSANTPYVVGEVGPELFVPNTSGQIIPNNKLSGGGGSTINFYYSPALSLSDKAEAEMRIKPMLRQILRGG